MTDDELLGGGVYILTRGSRVVYVGQSERLLVRISTHVTDGVKDFDGFSCEYVPDHLRDEAEQELINMYCPEYNIMLTGRGGGRLEHLRSRCRRIGLPEEMAEIIKNASKEIAREYSRPD